MQIQIYMNKLREKKQMPKKIHAKTNGTYMQIHAITIKYTHHFWLHIPVDKYIKNMQAYANIDAGTHKWLQI